MDLVTVCKRAPKGGETLLEMSFSSSRRKGSKSSCSYRKTWNRGKNVGKVGADSFGKDLIKSMNESGVDTSCIEEGKSLLV